MAFFGVTEEKIGTVRHVPNSDRLDVCTLDGIAFEFVTGRGEWKPGDECLYIPLDSLIPDMLAEKLGVRGKLGGSKKDRVRTVKLRGQVSQGLVAKLDLINDMVYPADTDSPTSEAITRYLGITKYEPPEPGEAGGVRGSHVRTSTLPPGQTIYDIEGAERNQQALLQLMQGFVSITEKLEGCLDGGSLINLPDGTTRQIRHIKEGDSVLGFDHETGKLVSTKVLHVFTPTPSKIEDWLIVSGTRKATGQAGSPHFTVKCTKNHMFFAPNADEYIPAENLSPGSVVLSRSHNSTTLTPIQEQILIGKILGDGSVHFSGDAAAITYSHSDKYREYIDITDQVLGDIFATRDAPAVSGKGSNMIRSRTVFSLAIRQLAERFVIPGGKKHVPADLYMNFGPIALAFLYMDDGSLEHSGNQEDRCKLSVCAFDDMDCNNLIKAINTLGIYPDLRFLGGYNYLEFKPDQAERLFLLVASYLPPSMKYKLPERYRMSPFWLPRHTLEQYKKFTMEQVVTDIRPLACVPYMKDRKTNGRHDITTETGNFFAHDILLHNSNWSCTLTPVSGKTSIHDALFSINSRKMSIKLESEDPESFHPFHKIYENNPELELLLQYLWYIYKGRQVILYGEYCGPGVQKNIYKLSESGVFLFDIKIGGEYLDPDRFLEVVSKFDIQTVPVLAHDVDLVEWITSHRPSTWQETIEEGGELANLWDLKTASNGESVLRKNQLREGIVIRPMIEQYSSQLHGRLILKQRSPEYLGKEKD